jgi:hypothetical protein
LVWDSAVVANAREKETANMATKAVLMFNSIKAGYFMEFLRLKPVD